MQPTADVDNVSLHRPMGTGAWDTEASSDPLATAVTDSNDILFSMLGVLCLLPAPMKLP